MSAPPPPRPPHRPAASGRVGSSFAGLMALMGGLLLFTVGCAGVRVILPVYTDIDPTDPLPIDGEYRLMENGKRYRFSQGRAWLLEEAFVGPLRYDPGQVTQRNLMQTGPRTYQGQDLASMGPVTLTVQDDDRVLIDIRTPVGPVQYTMVPIELEDPAWYRAQLQSETIVARSGGAPMSAPGMAGLAAVPGMTLAPSGTLGDPALSTAQRAQFGGYHALVIGNDGYRSLPRLGTAINDAKSISQLLRDRYDFEVETLGDFLFIPSSTPTPAPAR